MSRDADVMSEEATIVTIGIGQFRSDACNYVRRALAGEAFKVMRRGRLVAELHAAQQGYDTVSARISLAVARSRASWFFDRVEAGEVIVIEQRGKAVVAVRPCAR